MLQIDEFSGELPRMKRINLSSSAHYIRFGWITNYWNELISLALNAQPGFVVGSDILRNQIRFDFGICG